MGHVPVGKKSQRAGRTTCVPNMVQRYYIFKKLRVFYKKKECSIKSKDQHKD